MIMPSAARDKRNAKWRSLLIPEQDGLCPICGKRLFPMMGPLSIDHVLPKGRGGLDGLGNVLVTHWGCNNRKGGDLPTGCQLVWLLAVNCRLQVEPMRW